MQSSCSPKQLYWSPNCCCSPTVCVKYLGTDHHVPTKARAGRLLLPVDSEGEETGQRKEDEIGQRALSLSAMCHLPLLPPLLHPEVVHLRVHSTALTFGKGWWKRTVDPVKRKFKAAQSHDFSSPNFFNPCKGGGTASDLMQMPHHCVRQD